MWLTLAAQVTECSLDRALMGGWRRLCSDGRGEKERSEGERGQGQKHETSGAQRQEGRCGKQSQRFPDYLRKILETIHSTSPLFPQKLPPGGAVETET